MPNREEIYDAIVTLSMGYKNIDNGADVIGMDMDEILGAAKIYYRALIQSEDFPEENGFLVEEKIRHLIAEGSVAGLVTGIQVGWILAHQKDLTSHGS